MLTSVEAESSLTQFKNVTLTMHFFMFPNMLGVSSVTVAVEMKDMKWTATQGDGQKRNDK